MSHPPTIDESLEEKTRQALRLFTLAIQTASNISDEKERLDQIDKIIERTTKAIMHGVTEEVRQGRILEIERTIRGMHSVGHLMDEKELKDRIKELQALSQNKTIKTIKQNGVVVGTVYTPPKTSKGVDKP